MLLRSSIVTFIKNTRKSNITDQQEILNNFISSSTSINSTHNYADIFLHSIIFVSVFCIMVTSVYEVTQNFIWLYIGLTILYFIAILLHNKYQTQELESAKRHLKKSLVEYISYIDYSYVISQPIDILKTVNTLLSKLTTIIKYRQISIIDIFIQYAGLFIVFFIFIIFLDYIVPERTLKIIDLNYQDPKNTTEDQRKEDRKRQRNNMILLVLVATIITSIFILYSLYKELSILHEVKNNNDPQIVNDILQKQILMDDAINNSYILHNYNGYDKDHIEIHNILQRDFIKSSVVFKNIFRAIIVLFIPLLLNMIVSISFFYKYYKKIPEVLNSLPPADKYYKKTTEGLNYLPPADTEETKENLLVLLIRSIVTIAILLLFLFLFLIDNVADTVSIIITKFMKLNMYESEISSYIFNLCYRIPLQKVPIVPKNITNSGITIYNGELKLQQKSLFKNVHLNIGLGNLCYVAGESGAGKTSLFYILLDMYILDDGYYALNGNRPPHTDIVYVPQIPVLFGKTINDSITSNKKLAKDLLNTINKLFKINLTLQTSVDTLSIRHKQFVSLMLACHKKITYKSTLIIIDEPFSQVNNTDDINAMVHMINKYLRNSKSIVLISDHKGICMSYLNPDLIVFLGTQSITSNKNEICKYTPKDLAKNNHVMSKIPIINKK